MANAVDTIIVVSVLLLVSGVLLCMLRRKGHCSCEKCCVQRNPDKRVAAGGMKGESSGGDCEGACGYNASQCMTCCKGRAFMDAKNVHRNAS